MDLNVVTGILGNPAEEFVQVVRQFRGWETVVLGMVLLLKGEPMEARAKKFHCRLIKLLRENSGIEVVFILNKT